MRTSSLKTTLWLSASSFLVAVFSVVLGQLVWYLDYLFLFSFLAVAIVALSVAALIAGAIGLWQTKGRRWPLWVATFVPAVWLWFVISFG